MQMASSSSSSSTSMLKPDSRFISQGDLVLLWLSRDKDPVPVTVEKGKEDSNPFGTFQHDDMIGRPWGSRVYAKNKRGYVFLLRPTPSLWTLSLPHRTQILYYPDICFVALKLNLGPGSKLIEAGTGSGSFTHWSSSLVGRVDQWGNRKAEKQEDVERDLENGMKLVREQGWQGRHESMKKRWNWKGLERENDITKPIRGLKMSREQKEALKNSSMNAESSTPEPTQSESKSLVNGKGKEKIKEEEEGAGEREELGNHPIEFKEINETDGKVWSFEFHKGRKQKAECEFEAHGLLNSIVTLSHRDVCKSGFGLSSSSSSSTTSNPTSTSTSTSSNLADALFLDVPAPWEAIPHSLNALKPEITTRICCFSPCMEQVLKTVEALRKNGFDKIETFECLQKGYESHTWFEDDNGRSGENGNGKEKVNGKAKGKGKKRKLDDEDDDEEDEEEDDNEGADDDDDKEETNHSTSNLYSNPSLENSDISNAILKIREIETKKKNRRLNQIENARIEREKKTKEKQEKKEKEAERRRLQKEKKEKEEKEKVSLNGDEEIQLEEGSETKKIKLDVDEDSKEEDQMQIDSIPLESESKVQSDLNASTSTPTQDASSGRPNPNPNSQDLDLSGINADPDFPIPSATIASGRRDAHKTQLRPANVWAKVLPEMRGHTSYLTFAVLLPRVV